MISDRSSPHRPPTSCDTGSQHPEDPKDHQRLRIRTGADEIYDWEFDKGFSELTAAPGSITVDETQFALSLAQRGAALTFAPQIAIHGQLSRGKLEVVLDDWATSGPGLYVHYSRLGQVPTALQLLIDLIREQRPLGL
ncbi:LysR substrate-binding domain-containing protein [Caulobacter sp. 73W]|uniref:LysR substrate-binding domain-containing protein n=1 Tax=Caulobacter sp. 73W TaxID=3161137 RepID=A0AB39KZA5_9CAUL